MSDDTYRAVEEAIRAHLHDEQEAGRVLVDWFVVAAHAGAQPRETGYLMAHSDAPPHVMAGLIDYGAAMYDHSLNEEDDQ